MPKKKIEYTCPRCFQNAGGCGSQGASNLIYARQPHFRFIGSPTFEINPSRRWVGCEPELYVGSCTPSRLTTLLASPNVHVGQNVRLETRYDLENRAYHVYNPEVGPGYEENIPFFRVVSDGSIRGGMEINTFPMCGDQLIHRMKVLGEALDADGAYVVGNCSMHVHVDARDLTGADLIRLWFIWLHVQPAAWAAVRPDRRLLDTQYQYCRPVTLGGLAHLRDFQQYALNSAQGLRSIPESVVSAAACHGLSRTGKYWDMSYNSLIGNGTGTVEFRLMHGLTDGKSMGYWAAIMAAIVDHAKAGQGYPPAAWLPRTLPADSREALLKLTPRAMRYWLTSMWAKHSDSSMGLHGVPVPTPAIQDLWR